MDLYAVADMVNADLEISYIAREGRFVVSLEGAEIKDGSLLTSTAGHGKTLDEAMLDYARQIAKVTLVFGAFTEARREVQMDLEVIE